jgi:hypothetical protein
MFVGCGHEQAAVGGDGHGQSGHPSSNLGLVKEKKEFTCVSLVPSEFLTPPPLLLRSTSPKTWLMCPGYR